MRGNTKSGGGIEEAVGGTSVFRRAFPFSAERLPAPTLVAAADSVFSLLSQGRNTLSFGNDHN